MLTIRRVIPWTIKLSPNVKIIYPIAIVSFIPLCITLGKFIFSHSDIEVEAVSWCLHMTCSVSFLFKDQGVVSW